MRMMKIISLLCLLSAQVMAVSVGDKANYVKSKNTKRTKNTIKNASGSLEVLEHKTAGSLGAGFVIKLTYNLDVLTRGPQIGNVKIFVPESFFSPNFFAGLSANNMDYGLFTVASLGKKSAVDNNGVAYNDCYEIKATNIDADFAGSEGKAKIEEFNKEEGTISSVSELEIKFRACSGVPVLGAVEIDVHGKTNFGVVFDTGIDLN